MILWVSHYLIEFNTDNLLLLLPNEYFMIEIVIRTPAYPISKIVVEYIVVCSVMPPIH